jgi:hypothetical protein
MSDECHQHFFLERLEVLYPAEADIITCIGNVGGIARSCLETLTS